MKKSIISTVCLCGVLLSGCEATIQTNTVTTNGVVETVAPVVEVPDISTTDVTVDSEVEVVATIEEPDETFVKETESDGSAETEETFPAPSTPPETVEEHEYGGRTGYFSTSDYTFDFENKLWMTLDTVYVSNDECELLLFRNKEDAAIVRIAYIGVEKATGENTTLGMFRYVTDSNGDPWWDWDTESYVNYSLAISGDDVLQYFPVGAAVPSTIVLFPDAGDFYYYGAATEEEYENNECHWTKGGDLGLTWKPDSDSSTVGNFYYGKNPAHYEYGVWTCGSENIWIK